MFCFECLLKAKEENKSIEIPAHMVPPTSNEVVSSSGEEVVLEEEVVYESEECVYTEDQVCVNSYKNR